MIIAPILIYLLVRSGAFKRLVLPDAIIGESETVEEDGSVDLLGGGVALTTLRPSGLLALMVPDLMRLQGEYINPVRASGGPDKRSISDCRKDK